jgi:hypothetical protein
MSKILLLEGYTLGSTEAYDSFSPYVFTFVAILVGLHIIKHIDDSYHEIKEHK